VTAINQYLNDAIWRLLASLIFYERIKHGFQNTISHDFILILENKEYG